MKSFNNGFRACGSRSYSLRMSEISYALFSWVVRLVIGSKITLMFSEWSGYCSGFNVSGNLLTHSTLLADVGLLCLLRGTFSIGHQHGHPIEVGQQLIQGSSPTPSKLPSPSPPTFDTPIPFPTASPPVEAPSGIFPFMAPPPLEIPVITNPSTPELSGKTIIWIISYFSCCPESWTQVMLSVGIE